MKLQCVLKPTWFMQSDASKKKQSCCLFSCPQRPCSSQKRRCCANNMCKNIQAQWARWLWDMCCSQQSGIVAGLSIFKEATTASCETMGQHWNLDDLAANTSFQNMQNANKKHILPNHPNLLLNLESLCDKSHGDSLCTISDAAPWTFSQANN